MRDDPYPTTSVGQGIVLLSNALGPCLSSGLRWASLLFYSWQELAPLAQVLQDPFVRSRQCARWQRDWLARVLLGVREHRTKRLKAIVDDGEHPILLIRPRPAQGIRGHALRLVGFRKRVIDRHTSIMSRVLVLRDHVEVLERAQQPSIDHSARWVSDRVYTRCYRPVECVLYLVRLRARSVVLGRTHRSIARAGPVATARPSRYLPDPPGGTSGN